MSPQDFNGDDDAAGDALTTDVVITATATATATAAATAAAPGEKNGRWFRYVVISISVFISHNVGDNEQDDEAPAPPPPEDSLEQPKDRSDHVIGMSPGLSTAEEEVRARVVDEATAAPPPEDSLEQLNDRSDHVIEMPPRVSAAEEEDRARFVRIVKERDYSALRRLGGVDRVVSLQRCYFEETEVEALDGVQDSQKHWEASNQGRGFMYFLFQAFNSYTILLLFVSAGLLFAIEVIEEGPQDGWHDGVAVVFAIFLLVAFSSVGNFCRERKMVKKLLKERKKMEVKVERNDKCLYADVGNVKVWDTVHLEKGDQIPAEGLFIGPGSLKLDDVHSSEIDRDGNPFLGFGSKVKEGRGSMIVTSVGSYEALLLRDLHGLSRDTLLQSLMDKPYEYIEKLALSMSVLIAFIALVRLLFKKHDGYDELPEMKGHLTMKLLMEMFERIIVKPQGRVSILVSALVALVVGVQHGMPFVFGVCLSYWTVNLSNDRVSLQNISAGCTTGLVNVVIVDVTHGDLLRKKMEIKEFWIGKNEIMSKNQELAVPDSILHRGIGVWGYYVPNISASRARDHVLGSSEESKWETRDLEEKSQVLEYKRTSSSGKRGCEALLRKIDDEEQSLHLHWQGHPSTILEMCSHFYNCGGEIHAIETDQKRAFKELIENMENNGLRPIAVAYDQTKVRELKKDGLSLLAILGLKYTCRRDVKILVNALRDVGLIIKLASEDELPAVKSIAWELGFLRPDSTDIGVEARDLAEEPNMSVDEITMMGKSRPEDQSRMVQKLQENGHVVAVVGGLTARGTLTLQKADVGIVQQGSCSESATKSSDIVLKSSPADSLARITNRGRCMYSNIQKFYQIQLTTWISGLIIMLVSTMHSGESPITSVQMIWVNLILCLLGGLMMVMEFKSNKDQSAKRTEPLITKTAWKNVVIQVCYQVCALLIFQFFIGTKYASTKTEKNVLKTMIFNTFTMCQIFNLLNAMKLAKKEVLAVVCRSYWFLVALVTVLCSQVTAVQFGNGLLCSEKLNVRLWTTCFLLATLSLLFDSAMKLLISWFPDSYYLALSSVTSYFDVQRARRSFMYFLALPFSMFFLFSTTYYLQLDVANSIR